MAAATSSSRAPEGQTHHGAALLSPGLGRAEREAAGLHRAEVVCSPTAFRRGRPQDLDAARLERRHLRPVCIAVVREHRLRPAQHRRDRLDVRHQVVAVAGALADPRAHDQLTAASTCEAHGYPIDPQILAGIERAADVLSAAGYAVERVATPSIMKPAEAWFGVLVSEIAHFLGPVAREHGSETIQTIFEHYQRIGTPVDPAGYRQGIADRTALTRAWNVFLDRYPLVLSPFLMRPIYAWNYDAQGLEQVKDLFMAAIHSTGVNYLGLPAGVQLIGRRYREDLILDAMEAIEASVGILAHTLWEREGGAPSGPDGAG